MSFGFRLRLSSLFWSQLPEPQASRPKTDIKHAHVVGISTLLGFMIRGLVWDIPILFLCFLVAL